MENETVYNTNETEEYQSYSTNHESTKQYVQGMYDEFKRCFDNRNFGRIERIRNNIVNVDPTSKILNVIYGAIYLLKGDCVESYNFFMKYISSCTVIDPWVLILMGIWNHFVGEHKLALTQFSGIKYGEFSNRSISTVLFFVAKAKKRLGFLDRATNYLERLVSTPEGYRLISIIKLELIHILILKKRYDEAFQEINAYSSFYNNCYIERLRVYVMYLKGQYKEILKYKKVEILDPYISYMIARVGLEHSEMYTVDIPFYLDEAIRESRENEFIYNTYGNYCYTKQRFSDAAEHFSNALSVNPNHEVASHNLSLFVKAGSKSNKPIYVTKHPVNDDSLLIESVPDVEEMGFFDTWSLLGFSTFHIDRHFLSTSHPLKYYLNVD